MVGHKIKYSRSTKKYKGGNNMKELTYDELIKNTLPTKLLTPSETLPIP
jgi:hypothetical protein